MLDRKTQRFLNQRVLESLFGPELPILVKAEIIAHAFKPNDGTEEKRIPLS